MWHPIEYLKQFISNSKVITKQGEYALDAVQNNPNVQGSLRQELERVSEKVNKHVINTGNSYASWNTTHYIHLVRIKPLAAYCNYPIRFTIVGRAFFSPIDFIIKFTSANSVENTNLDTALTQELKTDNSCKYQLYYAKSSSDTYDIYLQCSGGGTGSVLTADIPKSTNTYRFEVTYPNILVDSLPDGALEFTQAT